MFMTKDEMKSELKSHVRIVSFTKANGDRRDMTCTLLPEYLPKQDDSKVSRGSKKENPDTLAVWDVDKEAWRSFRLDSVLDLSSVQVDGV